MQVRPDIQGRVIEVEAYAGGYQYLVLTSEGENWYAEEDLEILAEQAYRWEKRDEFLRDLLLAKMRHPIADTLYSYRASRTVFEPYQFRPVLKFLRNPEQRILIADEVGLGKTIEAAIIYLELKARTDISRVLVLCPARLKAKWIGELRNRFDEDFDDWDMTKLRRIFERQEQIGSVSFRAVASYEMLRRDEIVQEFENRNIPIDLLIADEAHYMRNSSTATYNLGEKLTDSADAVLFLTATPLHLGNQDLYQLLHLLLPGEYDSLDFFQHQIRPNQYINLAAKHLAAGDYSTALTELRKVEKLGASERFLRNPFYHEVVEALKTQVSDREKRIRLHRDLIELNTLSTVFTRTRKREVVNAAVRAPVAVMIQLTPQEREFYLGVVRHVRLELQRSGSTVHSFSIIARERMAASCLAAMREAFEEAARLKHGIKAEIDTPLFDTDPDEDPVIIESVNELRRLSLAIGKHDSKFDQFRLTLNQALREGEDSKALVFSFYRGTLNYLHRRLV